MMTVLGTHCVFKRSKINIKFGISEVFVDLAGQKCKCVFAKRREFSILHCFSFMSSEISGDKLSMTIKVLIFRST